MSRLALAAFAALLTQPLAAADPKPAANFTLVDSAGKKWVLADQKAKAVVVAFLAAECPMSNNYLPALAGVTDRYAAKGVAVIGVFPDPDTTAETVAAHAKEYKLPFPVLRDPAHAAVSSLGAKTTPEVVVLDENRVVRYRGRIDDGYVARMKPKAAVSRHDLTTALDELLAGKPVTLPEAKAFGCPIAPLENKAEGKAVTFHKDVLPILQAHCQSCHRPDQVAPFSLTTYKQAARWADLCLEEVEAKRMPPWKPAANPLLSGERSLPADAKKTLEAWVAQGKPEGDPKDAPPPAKFADGWTLGEPDLVLEAPADTTVAATGRDLFRVQVLPTNLPEDKFIVAMEVKPGNPRVVHHTLQLIDTTGRGRKLQDEAKDKPGDADGGPGYRVNMGWGFLPDRSGMLGGWAPGMLPKKLPDGVGQRLPKGADVLLQTHYHRTGKVETDRTRIGLYFATKPVTEKFVSVPAAGVFGVIPAGRSDFKVDSSWQVMDDVTLYRMTPHMHLLGKDIELTAALPGQEEGSLIRIPAWDYNWQEQYELKEPMKLPKGTVLRVKATYDNSADNPHNPSSPPALVRLGEQTTNEMCFVFLGVSRGDGKTARLLLPANGRRAKP
jgi:peroxiredoxin